MNLWTPEHLPPQLDTEALDIVSGQLDEAQGLKIIADAVADLETRHELFGVYLDEFGFDLNRSSYEGLWPAQALKASAAVTLLAYRESGIYHPVDEQAVEVGRFAAEVWGVPDAYVASACDDWNLLQLAKAVSESPMYDDSSLDIESRGGYEQVIQIGSGCARHFLQKAVELAA